jgi:hypothetical protein
MLPQVRPEHLAAYPVSALYGVVEDHQISDHRITENVPKFYRRNQQGEQR